MMGFCTPDGISPVNQFFYCQDNWLLIGIGTVVLIVIAALVLFAVVVHFLSLMSMVDWWLNKKEYEDEIVEDLTKRIADLEETIKWYEIVSPRGDAKNDEVGK
jgi:cytochrome b subunit of formate dehydrogenase